MSDSEDFDTADIGEADSPVGRRPFANQTNSPHAGQRADNPRKDREPERDHSRSRSPEREQAWADALKAAQVDLVVLAGFMRVIKAPLLDAFAGRIINLHPSLLPAFPGLDGIGQAWNAGVPEAGCTVHWVNAEIDGGAHLGQTRVAREPADTLDTFAQKIHAAEHALLPAVIARLSETLS